MRNISYIKFKWLNIFIVFLFSISIICYSYAESASSNSALQQKSVSVQITESTVITFPDKNLEKTIREEIQCPTGDILKEDVDKITNLQNTEDKHITNLSGIENLTNLTLLNLSNNQIKNIEPLKELTNLTNLDLATNQLSDIEPLKELTNLTILDLATNQMSNIDPLNELTNLTELNLDTNQIEDYSPVNVFCKNTVTSIITSTVIPPTQKTITASNQFTDSTGIIFSDGNLENLIRDTIQHLTGDIVQSDVDKIISPQPVQDKHIEVLSDIENLNHLDPDTNSISDIEPLK
ncbi:MAG: internalin A [Clostridium sp.]|jgi:internalin A